MVAVEEFSRLVAGVYAAAITPQRWSSTVHDLQQTFGATACSLLEADGAIWAFQDSTIPQAALDAYREHYCHSDYVLAAVHTSAIGVVRTGPEIIVPNRNPDFYHGWMRPNSLEDGLFVRLTGGDDPACFLVASPDSGFDTPDRIALMSALVCHLQQALGAQAKISTLANRVVEMAGALEGVRHGVLVVTRGGAVINANSRAEDILRAQDGLSGRHGRVVAENSCCARELHRALGLAIDGAPVRSGTVMVCARPSGKRPFVIHVVPSHRPDDDAVLSRSMALVVIVDPEQDAEPEPALLRRLFDLTDAEAEIALRMARGADVRQVSEELSISLTTVRTHLHHVFNKTQTHRQSELVRLLLTLRL